jgi:hypothetical protein
MYDQYGESDLNYHELLTEFLAHLCERTRKGPPLAAAPPASTPPPTTTAPTTENPDNGGVAPTARAAQSPTGTQIAGDQVYCTAAEHFTADLHTPPGISLLTVKLHTRERGGVQVSLTKISTVTLTVRRGGQVVWTNRALVEGGKPKLLWVTPSKPGSYSVTLLATDLAGNFSTATGTIVVSRR